MQPVPWSQNDINAGVARKLEALRALRGGLPGESLDQRLERAKNRIASIEQAEHQLQHYVPKARPVSGAGNYSGFLGNILRCHATGTATGEEFAFVGGLVGAVAGTTVIESYATGTAEGGNTASVGGLAGTVSGGLSQGLGGAGSTCHSLHWIGLYQPAIGTLGSHGGQQGVAGCRPAHNATLRMGHGDGGGLE